MKKSFIICFLISQFLWLNVSVAETCQPLLWPNSAWSKEQINKVPESDLAVLIKQGKKSLRHAPQAIPSLNSAGKIDVNDSKLQLSRQAVREADEAAILALLYKLTNNPSYMNATRAILLKWANVNDPTGHPIDETRLAGLIWAYDLTYCQLTGKEQKIILNWLEKMRQRKLAWKFGPQATSNNHRIHQLKMLLLLDKVLKKAKDWQRDFTDAQKYSTINLNPTTGVSIDYQQRSSLYYHNYDLQPWLEINLITDDRFKTVDKGFEFLIKQINAHHINNEFIHSTAKIDALRAKGGFTYAKPGGTFDVTRATPTILTYYTNHCDMPTPALMQIINSTKSSPWLAFVKVRRYLWNRCPEQNQ